MSTYNSDIDLQKSIIIDGLNQYITLLQFLKEVIPSKIYLSLRMHEELSLRELSLKLNKSKTTITRYVKEMLENNVLIESKHKRTMYYRISDTLKNLQEPFGRYPELNELYPQFTNKEKMLVIRTFSENVKTIFILFDNLVDQSILYLDLKKKILLEAGHGSTQKYIEHFGFSTDILFLDKLGYDLLMKHYFEFIKKFREEYTRISKGNTGDIEYLLWSIVLPLDQILQIRT